MSRALCPTCHRPEKACICAFAVSIDNHIDVIVLQHPSEVKQSKGTVSLLQQSLTNCQVIVGETFDQCQLLTQRLSQYGDNVVLLYPSEQALLLNFSSLKVTNNLAVRDLSPLSEVKCIIILDGTWKKAYRMFMLNAFLHQLKHVVLPEGISSLYQIRKTKKENALSSFEACCHALARLENAPGKYQKLLSRFVDFNLFQQSFSKGAE